MRKIYGQFFSFIGLLFCVCAIHYDLLTLPFFWDEAGYYIPATVELLVNGALVPATVPTVGHPPLVMAYVAAAWRLFGISPLAARLSMCAWAAFALLGALRISKQLTSTRNAVFAVGILASYSIFFVQSTLVQLDLPVTALSLWAFDAILERNPRRALPFLGLCAAAKATGILTSVAVSIFLAFYYIKACPEKNRWVNIRNAIVEALLGPALILVIWLSIHYRLTGHPLGDPVTNRFNTVWLLADPSRILVAIIQRLWHVTGHMGLWALVAPFMVLCWNNRSHLSNLESPRTRALVLAAAMTLVYGVAFSLVGGAVLARYMLPAVALIIVVASSFITAWMSQRKANLCLAIVLVVFVVSLVTPPPYHTAIEDGLMYRDFVRLHQQAANFLADEYANHPIITAWPGSAELTRPYLGYVTNALKVREVASFDATDTNPLMDTCPNCVLYAFNTRYEPADSVFRPGLVLNRLLVWRQSQVAMAQRSSPRLVEISTQANAAIITSKVLGPHFTAVLIRKVSP